MPTKQSSTDKQNHCQKADHPTIFEPVGEVQIVSLLRTAGYWHRQESTCILAIKSFAASLFAVHMFNMFFV
jgi:hypothetical protein